MSSSEDVLVGGVAAIVAGLIAWRIGRGLREGRLPVYRTYLSRDENAGKFNLLLVLHGLSFLVVATIAADLLFNLNLRDAS
jgi:hypothetical protein